MTDLIERLEALAGKVTLDNCVTARTAAKAEIRTLCTNNLPTIIAALKLAELVRDEDWLVDQIRDYFPQRNSQLANTSPQPARSSLLWGRK
ncbi:MAG: hypothetical protein IPG83_02565 [Novosphingobium sp.]|nr:hypothetical protein [Novosphingobium sp.]